MKRVNEKKKHSISREERQKIEAKSAESPPEEAPKTKPFYPPHNPQNAR